MRLRRAVPLLLVGGLLVAGCGDADPLAPEPEAPEVVTSQDLGATLGFLKRVFVPRIFTAVLTPGQEVAAEPVKSAARGLATFQLSLRGNELRYAILVSNIDNVTMAHIHLAPRGVNGPVVVWLYPDFPPAQLIPGRTDGHLASGILRDENVVGLLGDAGLPGLLAALRSGEAYVNVHTSRYPGGEIRGQISGIRR